MTNAEKKRERFAALMQNIQVEFASTGEVAIDSESLPHTIFEKIGEIIECLKGIFASMNVDYAFQTESGLRIQNFIAALLYFQKGLILVTGPADLTYINCRVETIVEEWSM